METMKAVIARAPGGPEVLEIVDCPIPSIGPSDVLVRTRAIGVNRPDIRQRQGLYPPPPGVTDILGLDLAGTVAAVGVGVTRWKVGDLVCALVAGGAYAEYCAVPEPQCLPIPIGLGMEEAASLPEVFFTAWTNVFDRGRLGDSEVLLVQGGTSGVGLAAIQMAKVLRNAVVAATVSSDEKAAFCRDYGADHVFDYRTEDWRSGLRAATGGADVILDAQAGDYLQDELSLLRVEGRLVLIATHRGKKVEVDVDDLFRRRLTLTGSTLRPRTPEQKGLIARSLETCVWPKLASREIRTFVQSVFDFADVGKAHNVLDANRQIGKIVLRMPDA
ncbi:NAD(P)H-quinone oxidoreductase [Shumkonia mesophila]|uniref:NAD(P)H-quinone oxidoreductase n=1 Tax=Shumkonia mesophila TaxID=2838854 RepID=UPI002934C39B|nr:NAD(P)H-quinone oxidoreductase [Shumkonia mesophila]